MALSSGAEDVTGAERQSRAVVKELGRSVDVGGDREGRAGPTTVDAEPAALEWRMAGLPQISPARLTQALAAPVALELTGPGARIWTRDIPNPACRLFQFEL
jgi:hypothetical protein